MKCDYWQGMNFVAHKGFNDQRDTKTLSTKEELIRKTCTALPGMYQILEIPTACSDEPHQMR